MSLFAMRPFFLFLILFVSASAVLAQESAPPTPVSPVNIDRIYLAKDDGSGKAGDPVTGFSTTDIPIYCVVLLDSNRPVTVKMNLVAEKVQGVKPDTRVVTVSYTTKDGQNRVNFTGRPAGKWVIGTYRADIYLDNKLVKNVIFDIKTPAKNTESAALVEPLSTPRSSAARKRN